MRLTLAARPLMTRPFVSTLDPERPVLIAGPTASGKSALALEIAEEQGGLIVNADASQVYDCWRIVTARPSVEEEARAPHALYGHIGWDQPYSAGHWLRDVRNVLRDGQRPIIVGGTGLYFLALTEGLAEIPPTDPAVRAIADSMALCDLLSDLDKETRAQIDTLNRARVQRAWEVRRQTGRGLAAWQADTPPPDLPLDACDAFVMDASKEWLESRIFRRFEAMMDGGALDEVVAMREHYDPSRPAFRAIGVPELVDYLDGITDREETLRRAGIATRQFAKRQRTWFRKRMRNWTPIRP